MRSEPEAASAAPDQAGAFGSPIANLRLIHNLVALSGGEVFSKAIGFVVFAYLARALEPGAYGALELAVSLSVFFAIVTDLGLSPIGAREVARGKVNARALAAEIPALRIAAAVLLVPVMGLVGISIAGTREQAVLIWLFALSLIPIGWTQRWLFQGLERMRVVASAQVVRMLVFGVVAVLLIDGPEDLLAAGWAEITATLACAGFLLAIQGFQVGRPLLSYRPASARRLIREGIPLGLSQTVWTLGQYLPILLIAWFHGSVEAAWFGAAHRIAFSLGTFSSVYHFNLFPELSRGLADQGTSHCGLARTSVRAVSWGGTAIALLLTVASGPLCQLVYGPEFANAAVPMSILVWMFPATLLYGHARTALIAAGRQRQLLVAQISGAAGTLVSGLALIPSQGAIGGAVSMLIGVGVVWLVSRSFARLEIGPIRDVGTAIKAGGSALCSILLTGWLGLAVWWSVLLAMLLLGLTVWILDRELALDLRRIARAWRARSKESVSRGKPGRGLEDTSDR